MFYKKISQKSKKEKNKNKKEKKEKYMKKEKKERFDYEIKIDSRINNGIIKYRIYKD